MKKTSRISIVMVTVCAYACVLNQMEDLQLGESQGYLNLRLYPVLANTLFLEHRSKMGEYLSLEEAVRLGKVLVTEHVSQTDSSREETVNTLFIENLSSDTVLILNGETVRGGHQDRMVTMDVLLEPRSGKLDLEVYCVERGRWTGDTEVFSVAEQSLSPNNIRSVAASGNANQLEVWEEVKVSLDINVVNSESERLNDLHESKDFETQLAEYMKKLSNVFSNHSQVVGVVAVSGNEIIACDLFATPALFKKHFPNLLQSYSMQVMGDEPQPTDDWLVEAYWQKLQSRLSANDGFLRRSNQQAHKAPAHFSAPLE